MRLGGATSGETYSISRLAKVAVPRGMIGAVKMQLGGYISRENERGVVSCREKKLTREIQSLSSFRDQEIKKSDTLKVRERKTRLSTFHIYYRSGSRIFCDFFVFFLHFNLLLCPYFFLYLPLTAILFFHNTILNINVENR